MQHVAVDEQNLRFTLEFEHSAVVVQGQTKASGILDKRFSHEGFGA